MKKTLCTLAVALTSAVVLNAQTFDFTLTFEPVGGAATGSGGGTLAFDSSTSELTFNNITWEGISGTYTASHIHGPEAEPGEGAGVLYNLDSFLTLDGSEQSGSYSGTLEFVDGVGGGNYSITEQVDQLMGNQWYINIHSSPDFGGGEIRGTIELVPEPSTFALLGLGAAGLVCWRFRRRH